MQSLNLLLLFQERLSMVRRDKHKRVWSSIFRDKAWAIEAVNAGFNPALIGPRLDVYYSYRFPSKAIYVYLDVGDKQGDFKYDQRELFFKSLMPHSYNEATKEVKFDKCGITLNISDLFTEHLELVQSKALSRHCLQLQSKYVYLDDPLHALRRIRLCDIYDAPKGMFDSPSDVDTCRLDLDGLAT